MQPRRSDAKKEHRYEENNAYEYDIDARERTHGDRSRWRTNEGARCCWHEELAPTQTRTNLLCGRNAKM
jgi:hypothetical protein